MTRIPRHCWLTLLGTALPLLVALALPVVARAECGDYVRMGDFATHHAPMSDPGHPAPGVPCTGPNCSQRPLPFTPPVPARITITGEDWAYSITLIDPPPAPRVGCIDLVDSCSPTGFASDIF